MSAQLVTVFGGTGYLGRHVVARLVADGVRVRVAVRHPEAAAGLWDGQRVEAGLWDGQRVEAVTCDLRDMESITAALDGAGGAVNAVGLYHEGGGYTDRSLLVLLLDQLELTGALMPMPFVVWEALAGLLRALPRPPVTYDQITLMKKDNVVGLGMPGLAALGIEARSVEAILPTYLG